MLGFLFKAIALLAVTVWTASIWLSYADKKNQAESQAEEAYIYQSAELPQIPQPKEPKSFLTQAFWQWEAKGRLRLIDMLLEDEQLAEARNNWQTDRDNLEKMARHITDIQLQAYAMDGRLQPVIIEFIPLKGDGNGLYKPQQATMYLNTKMQWDHLPFERFLEVVLHENMHHIMTTGHKAFGDQDVLKPDFKALAEVAYFHQAGGMAQNGREMPQVNPQELVAYRTQRAARYAGILGSDTLSAWEMSTRMQEIRVISKDAGF